MVGHEQRMVIGDDHVPLPAYGLLTPDQKPVYLYSVANYEELNKQFMCLLEKVSHTSQKKVEYGPGNHLYKSEIHVIDIVGKSQEIHISEIARNFGISKAAVSQLIKKVARKGLVRKYTDPANQTRVLVELTEKGFDAYYAHIEEHRRKDKKMFEFLDSLDDHELGVISDFLNEANQFCERHI